MMVGRLLVIIALVAKMYDVNAAKMQCLAYRESSYNLEARNGIHVGLYQYNPETFHWFLEMALEDPTFVHKNLFEQPDPRDPLQAITLTAWALRNGYAHHWSAWPLCENAEEDGK